MKRNNIIILIIISLIPLIFSTTLPYVLAKRLSLNILSSTEHIYGFEPKLYVISLQKGNLYTINALSSGSWDMDITIKISDTPYILAGQTVDEISNNGDIMNFVASRTGDHYIQINSKSGSGYFYIRIDNGITNPATGPLRKFSSSLYLLVLILPSVIILLVGIGISLISRKRSKSILIKKSFTSEVRQKEKEEGYFCPFCGSKIESFLQICPKCGSSQK